MWAGSGGLSALIPPRAMFCENHWSCDMISVIIFVSTKPDFLVISLNNN